MHLLSHAQIVQPFASGLVLSEQWFHLLLVHWCHRLWNIFLPHAHIPLSLILSPDHVVAEAEEIIDDDVDDDEPQQQTRYGKDKVIPNYLSNYAMNYVDNLHELIPAKQNLYKQMHELNWTWSCCWWRVLRESNSSYRIRNTWCVGTHKWAKRNEIWPCNEEERQKLLGVSCDPRTQKYGLEQKYKAK